MKKNARREQKYKVNQKKRTTNGQICNQQNKRNNEKKQPRERERERMKRTNPNWFAYIQMERK